MPILDQFNLAGKIAIVTGAARGLGTGLALAMAEAGAHVAAVYRTDAYGIREKIESLGGSGGGGRKCALIQADLANPAHIPRIIDETLAAFGRIDILINNAGLIRRASVIDFTDKDWDDVIAVNQRAVFFLSQAAAKVMIKQNQTATPAHPPGGRIINIASMLSFQGGIRVGAYTAAKSALLGITRIFANELAPHKITVNAIAPGYMATDQTAPLRADEKRNAEILARIPANRWGTADDLKGAAVFLASPASDYVTGHTLAVDGGWLSR